MPPKRGGKSRASIKTEILFLERVHSFLKPGNGRVAIVLPDGILTNAYEAKVSRSYLNWDFRLRRSFHESPIPTIPIYILSSLRIYFFPVIPAFSDPGTLFCPGGSPSLFFRTTRRAHSLSVGCSCPFSSSVMPC
jgi:hypothetical protein